MPEIDEIQNWNLVSGRENDTHSVLVFRRKLDTCDNNDRKIDDSTTRLIYAYSNEDPPSENSLKYHFKKRGTKSVLLLQLKRSNQMKIDKSTLTYWDVLSPNTDHLIGISAHTPQRPMVTYTEMGTVGFGPHGLLR
ncbi:DBH-like monooxygenase protein 1 [Trichonephila clavipes]|nr:DBH-like monooxygenase protein 1 [Trichonephila clavipes]